VDYSAVKLTRCVQYCVVKIVCLCIDGVAGSFRHGVLTSTPASEQTMLNSLQRVFTFLTLTEVRLSKLVDLFVADDYSCDKDECNLCTKIVRFIKIL